MASKGVAVGLLEYSRQLGRRSSLLDSASPGNCSLEALAARGRRSSTGTSDTTLLPSDILRGNGSISPRCVQSNGGGISPSYSRSTSPRNGGSSGEASPNRIGEYHTCQAPTVFLSLNDGSPPTSPRGGGGPSPRRKSSVTVAPPSCDAGMLSGSPRSSPRRKSSVKGTPTNGEISSLPRTPSGNSGSSRQKSQKGHKPSSDQVDPDSQANALWTALCGGNMTGKTNEEATFEYYHGLLEWERKQRKKTETKLQEKRSALWNAQQEVHEKVLAHEEERTRLTQALQMKNKVLEFERSILQSKYDQEKSNADQERDKLKHQLGQHALCLRSLLKEVSALQLEREALKMQMSRREYSTDRHENSASEAESSPEDVPILCQIGVRHRRHKENSNSYGWVKEECRADDTRCRMPRDLAGHDVQRQANSEAEGHRPGSSARTSDKAGSCNGSQGVAYFRHMEAYAKRLRKDNLWSGR